MSSKIKNQQVYGSSNYRRAAPAFHESHRTHMLIVALDYTRTGRPLSCSHAAKAVEEMSRQCGVQWLKTVYGDDCTREAVLAAVSEMTARCGPNDVFVLYFAGHGASPSGDASRSGESLVLVDRYSQVSSSTLLPGDELASAVIEGTHPETRVIFLMDTCHSEVLVDLRRGAWDGREAIVITGTQDPFAKDEDRGSIFTHAMLLAIDKLSKVGRDNYSVGMLFNALLLEDELVFGSAQDVTIQTAPRLPTDAMAWPLVPPSGSGYRAPLSRCAGRAAVTEGFGIARALSAYVRTEALDVPVSVEEYISHVQGQSLFNVKLHRACNAGCSTGGCALQ
mmetsp:Transcript_34537/g.98208  ORF Transcript_34537/g.98208 Transcript_34537/m.98208 type:complete len:336 (+) Transcript_34537:60-1067(+)